MPIDAGDPRRDAPSLDEAVDTALAGLPEEDRAAAGKPVNYGWLGIGIRLGLDRPAEARDLLAIGGPDASLAADDSGAGSPAESGSVPVRSALLARSAAVPFAERASIGREVTFGWAAMLTRGEIERLGRAVQAILAEGAPADIGKGFGLAWDAGVRLPHRELDQLFREFTELQMTVAGVLVGHDLSAEPVVKTEGVSGLFAQLVPRARPGEAQAAAAMESSGDVGRLGLVASWNAWMAMRYRELIPQPTHELLVHPWVTVVGSLPEP